LGIREPEVYGTGTLQSIYEKLELLAVDLGVQISMFQSNHEGDLVTKIQECLATKIDGILINPAAYGHTSIAIRDALKLSNIPFVEVHISNVYAREEFRQRSMLSDLASGVVIGFGANSYILGLRGLVLRVLEANPDQ
jgi:3-dehydroquinate dehydratase-2